MDLTAFKERRKHMIKIRRTICAALLGITALGAGAQTNTDIQTRSDSSAYVQDSRGVIIRSNFGLCWRTGYWTPADAVPGCDGELLPPVANPTAPPVATATAPLAEPAKPVPVKRCDFALTLQNDETFTFNHAILGNAAKQRIDDEVLGKLNTCGKIDIVLVTGHTDRLGTQQYNQKLSEKRAEMVASYLRSKGVSAPLDVIGVGKTQSIKTCSDQLARKDLIACLAPDRRVVIEVRGTAKP